MPATDEWLSVAEVARRIGASTSTVRGLIRTRQLRAIQHTAGGKYVIRESECARYLAEIEHAPTAQAA